MNYELFIAKRLIAKKEGKNNVSSSIIKIAIVSIAVSIVVMLLAISTGVGLKLKIKEKLAALNGHVIISNFNLNSAFNSDNAVSTKQDFYPNFTSVDGIKSIQTFALKAGIIRTEKDFESVVLKGVGTDYNWSFFKEYLVNGSVPNLSDKPSNEVLISTLVSNRLGLKVGDKFSMWFVKQANNNDQNFNINTVKQPKARSFKVVGIYSSGVMEFDKTYLLGDIKHIQRLNKWQADEVGGFEVFVDDFDELPAKGIEIYENIDPKLNSRTIADKNRNLFEWLDMFDVNIRMIIFIMIIISGINMITALLVLILERTQMIGILKSLGNSNRSIRKIFLYNAAYIILKGLFWGNVIGIGLLLLQKSFGFITLNPEHYFVNKVPVYINFGYILVLNLGTLFLCILMLIIPTMMVSKITPIKTIKF
ncbi:MAG: FtsX-like permease family protein [Flavobacteriaceae bacterium]